MVNNKRQNVQVKNFDFIFCDFIKHPIASIIRDNIREVVSITNIILKLAKKMKDTMFWKLFI